MKNKLLIFASLLLFVIGVEAQETPANRTRSGDAFTQIDNYLVAMKRLGIPSGDTPSLDATTDSENTAKLFFNTTDTALYVYREDLSEWLKVSAESDGGTVTSVGLEAPTGFSVSNSPITSSGNIELEFEDGYSLPTNIKQSEWDEAFSWGDFRDYGLGDVELIDDTWDLDENKDYTAFIAGVDHDIPGVTNNIYGIRLFRSDRYKVQMALRNNKMWFQTREGGNTQPWNEIWHSGNLTKLSDLNNDLSLQDVMDNNNSANNLKITDLADGTDPLDAVNKQQLDGVESPFEIIDVTQQAYSDIAINVKDFGNTQAGMTYQEGAIDFGVSRDSIHEMGLYSFKVGADTRASGTASSAFGSGTVASETASSAFGSGTRASGTASSAFGSGTVASGDASSAFGSGTVASGDASSAFGGYTEASGDYSSAFGSGTEASGDYSSAFGSGTESSGSYSSAFGGGTVASGEASSAFGGYTEASGDYSSAFGNRNVSNEYASLAIGRYSTNGAAEISWTYGSPILKVGNGTSSGSRKNAYTLYNDGKSEQESTFEITTPGEGVILSSPDGTRWEITVDNNGELTTTEL